MKMAPGETVHPKWKLGAGEGIFLDDLRGEFAALVFGDHDFIGARGAHGFGVTLLASAGDNFKFGVERFGSDGDVEIVCVVVDDDAEAAGAVDEQEAVEARGSGGKDLSNHRDAFKAGRS